jgi:hypothetical protein
MAGGQVKKSPRKLSGVMDAMRITPDRSIRYHDATGRIALRRSAPSSQEGSNVGDSCASWGGLRDSRPHAGTRTQLRDPATAPRMCATILHVAHIRCGRRPSAAARRGPPPDRRRGGHSRRMGSAAGGRAGPGWAGRAEREEAAPRTGPPRRRRGGRGPGTWAGRTLCHRLFRTCSDINGNSVY